MNEDERRIPQPIELGSGRLEAFSDAVMAVIITILALELRPPNGVTLEAVRAEGPSILLYVLSFAFIAIYWNNHHHLLRATTRISGGVMWANMVLLFCLSLIPVVTEWLRGFYREPLPAASFGVVGLAAAFSYYALVRAILRASGRDLPECERSRYPLPPWRQYPPTASASCGHPAREGCAAILPADP